MDGQKKSAKPPRRAGKQDTTAVKRLMITFLPQALLVIATFLTTAVYAGIETARIGAVIPLLRLFDDDSETTAPKSGEAEAPGGGDAEPAAQASDDKGISAGFSPTLDALYKKLDIVEIWFADLFGVEGDKAHRKRVGALCTVTAWFIIVAVLSVGFNLLHLVLRAKLVISARVTLQNRLCENLLRQPLAFHNDQKRGELITRLTNDVTGATICLNTLTGPMLSEPFRLLFPIVLIISIKWWFAFIVAGFIAAIMIQVRKQTRKVHRRAKVRQRTIARVTEAMMQMFSGIRVVKAFGLEDVKTRHYRRRNEDFARDAMATEVAKAWTRSKMELVTNVILVLAVLVATVVIGGGGNLSPDIILIFGAFLTQMYRPSKALTRAYGELMDNLAGAGRVFEFLDLVPGMPDRPDAKPLNGIAGRVRYENVSFSYKGNGKVLRGIDLDVPAGEVVAFVGHSGAGKSTLVNLVPRFYDPDEGSIFIDGVDIRDCTRESLLSAIAIVTQEPFLFNTSVRENIAYGRQNATDEDIIAAARAAQIHDFIVTLPRGYDTHVGERGANLSGGQCQRVTIARAILRDPKILILDEATSSLDTESEHAVQKALQNLMHGRTTLVIAHRLSTVKHADRICVLQEGRIVEMGNHSDLMGQESSLYGRLYRLQFGVDD